MASELPSLHQTLISSTGLLSRESFWEFKVKRLHVWLQLIISRNKNLRQVVYPFWLVVVWRNASPRQWQVQHYCLKKLVERLEGFCPKTYSGLVQTWSRLSSFLSSSMYLSLSLTSCEWWRITICSVGYLGALSHDYNCSCGSHHPYRWRKICLIGRADKSAEHQGSALQKMICCWNGFSTFRAETPEVDSLIAWRLANVDRVCFEIECTSLHESPWVMNQQGDGKRW